MPIEHLASAGGENIFKIVTQLFLRHLGRIASGLAIDLKLTDRRVARTAKQFVSQIGTYRLFAEQDREVFVGAAYAEMRITPESPKLGRLETAPFAQQPFINQAEESAIAAVAPSEALAGSDRGFCLLGTAGGGKSTILRYLSVQAAQGREFRDRPRLPVFLRGQDITSAGVTIRESVIDFFRHLGLTPAESTAEKALEKGALMIVVDGLDEVDGQHVVPLVREMSQLIHEHPDSLVCCSGRPVMQRSLFSKFQFWEPLPLNRPEQETFVRKWFAGLESGSERALLHDLDEVPELSTLGSKPSVTFANMC
jgi:hypothetical protein